MQFDEQKLAVLREHVAAPLSYPLAKLWQELTAGEWRIALAYSYSDQCFLELQRQTARAKPSLLCARRRAIAESVLTGRGQKVTAIELDRTQSAMSALLSTWLRGLGLPCSASRAPLLLMLAAYAAQETESPRQARFTRHNESGNDYYIVSAPRPDGHLAACLSPAEFTTARLLLDGLSHAAIARIRGTSLRTVANQLGAAFRKAGVSGRSELLAAAMETEGAAGQRHAGRALA